MFRQSKSVQIWFKCNVVCACELNYPDLSTYDVIIKVRLHDKMNHFQRQCRWEAGMKAIGGSELGGRNIIVSHARRLRCTKNSAKHNRRDMHLASSTRTLACVDHHRCCCLAGSGMTRQVHLQNVNTIWTPSVDKQQKFHSILG